MVVELLGPHTWTLDVVLRQVRLRGCRHAKVPGTSVWDLSEVCTRMSHRLRSRRCATTGGAGKIVAVRVSREDLEVVKQNVLNARTQGVLSDSLLLDSLLSDSSISQSHSKL